MKKNVAISDIGNDSEMMNVLHESARKKKMISTARMPPMIASLRTSSSELWMKID